MILILFDIHQNILSAQCNIYYSTAITNRNVEVLLKINKICFVVRSSSNFVCYSNINFPETLFDMKSITSVCCKNLTNYDVCEKDQSIKWIGSVSQSDENPHVNVFQLGFRIKITDASLLEKCVLKNYPILNFKDFMKSEIACSQNYNIICTSCSTSISVKETCFHLVSKYDESTSELSENWFCHTHDACMVPDVNYNTLYIGDMHFYISTSVIDNLSLSKTEKEYKCFKCSSVLSFMKKTLIYQNFIGFFCDKIMFQKSETAICDVQVYRNKIALYSFNNVLEEILKSDISCKIYLQSKAGEEITSLLLWTNSQKVLQFLQETNSEDISSEVTFSTKEVYKVLYLVPASDSDVAKKWKHDFGVEFFQISDNMMETLKQILQKGTECNLVKNGTRDEFSLGYLPAFTYIS